MTDNGKGYRQVRATEAEVEAYRAKHGGRAPAVYRAECLRCGKRIWLSGLGVGSHDRWHRDGRSAGSSMEKDHPIDRRAAARGFTE